MDDQLKVGEGVPMETEDYKIGGYNSTPGSRCRSCCMESRSYRMSSRHHRKSSGLISRQDHHHHHPHQNNPDTLGLHKNIWPSLRIHTLPWTPNYVSWTIVALVTLHCLTCTASPVSSSLSSSLPSDPPVITDFTSSHVFSDRGNKMYFRYMTFSESGQSLYVGAMEYIYRLKLSDISFQAVKSGNLSQYTSGVTPDSIGRSVQICRFKNKQNEGFMCKNHIRAIIQQGSSLYLCGTAATKPLDIFINERNMDVERFGAFNSGENKCGCDPNMLSTILPLKQSSSSDLTVYSGTNIEANLGEPVIHRTTLSSSAKALSTVSGDNKWLNEPEFIASFDASQFVYIFIRESALENINCGKTIFSRVVRVCKNDQGGGNSAREKTWTSFIKARLNCSIAGEYPYYFNQLEDVFKLGDKYFGVFTTPQEGMNASAVCAFTNVAITRAFSGTVKEQMTPTSNWLAVPPNRLPPNYKPGTCHNDSRLIPDSTLQFTKARPLMDEAVPTDTAQPYLWATGLNYQKIVVDEVPSRPEYKVIFLATDDGDLHKYSLWFDSRTGHFQSRLLAIWKPFSTPGRVWQMLLKDHELYMSSDSKVAQVPVRQCQKYKLCSQCVLDPYCGWDRTGCQNFRSGMEQSVEATGSLAVCGSYCLEQEQYIHNLRVLGDPVFFNCSSKCKTDSPVEWYFSRHQGDPKQRITMDNTRYFLTKDNGLIMFGISSDNQRGSYTCEVPSSSGNNVIFAKHILNTLECSTVEQCWKKEFSNWCKRFDQYQEEFSHWQCMKNECVNDESNAENCDLRSMDKKCKEKK